MKSSTGPVGVQQQPISRFSLFGGGDISSGGQRETKRYQMRLIDHAGQYVRPRFRPPAHGAVAVSGLLL
jgi:hypothetical protein